MNLLQDQLWRYPLDPHEYFLAGDQLVVPIGASHIS